MSYGSTTAPGRVAVLWPYENELTYMLKLWDYIVLMDGCKREKPERVSTK